MINLATALRKPSAYPHQAGDVDIVETHISLVFLTGLYAYKVKKAVNLGFLDFTTLQSREYFCRQELLLNRRLCPELYLDVVPVTEQSGKILIDGNGTIIDYAVKMEQFDRSMELDALLSAGKMTGEQIDQISRTVAEFHHSIPAAGHDTPYGLPETLIKPVRDNFTEAERLSRNSNEALLLDSLKRWTENEFRCLEGLFFSRKKNGYIKQCHGDMHTGNMVLWKNKVTIFDCIEFNPVLNHIDVISEIAFLAMDLEHSGRSDFAWRFLNDYFSLTGDYSGLPLLRFYKTYRAMVRAKVTAIRYLQEKDPAEQKATFDEHNAYLLLASGYTSSAFPGLLMTCGFSGSGKTTVAREFALRAKAIHIRSDIERKRLFGLKPLEKSSSELKKPMYSPEASEQTYAILYTIASVCLESGYTVIVDATFLEKGERKRFMDLGEKMNCETLILHCQAPQELLEERVKKRTEHGIDASEAGYDVLLQQIETFSPLSLEEERKTVTIDSSLPLSTDSGLETAMRRIKEKT